MALSDIGTEKHSGFKITDGDKLEELIGKDIFTILTKWGENLVNDLERDAPMAFGKLKESLVFDIAEKSGNYRFIINPVAYAHFADKGRKAGKKPPLDIIISWIKQKRIPSFTTKGKVKTIIKKKNRIHTLSEDERNRRTLAFLIQRKIGLEGTKGNSFWSKNVNKDRFSQLEKALRTQISDDIRVSLQNIKLP